MKLGIAGAGAFGSALAVAFDNHDVSLFTSFVDHAEQLKNEKALKNIKIDTIDNIQKYKHDYILWCYPIAPSVEILYSIRQNIAQETKIIICAKGICANNQFIHDAFTNILPNNDIGILSGPNFAVDLSEKRFAISVIGFKNIITANTACANLSNNTIRLLPSDDVVGLQIAGTIKNIIAIAGGIAIGLHMGQNALAALLTFGLTEMCNIGCAFGAKTNTFFGPAGVGDLLLTASSETSRNVSFGKLLATSDNAVQTMNDKQITCEGLSCLHSVWNLCSEHKINAPICNFVKNVVTGIDKPSKLLDIISQYDIK